MDAISIFSLVFTFIIGCVAVDWHFRGVGEKKLRRALHAEVESYMKPLKRI